MWAPGWASGGRTSGRPTGRPSSPSARSLEASAGTASFPADGDTQEEVLLAADRALFVAKRSGGARVASAAEGTVLAGEFTLQAPTPIDSLAATA